MGRRKRSGPGLINEGEKVHRKEGEGAGTTKIQKKRQG